MLWNSREDRLVGDFVKHIIAKTFRPILSSLNELTNCSHGFVESIMMGRDWIIVEIIFGIIIGPKKRSNEKIH